MDIQALGLLSSITKQENVNVARTAENERYYRSNSKKEAVLEAYQSQVIAPAVAAYENAISTFSNSVIENI